MDEKREWLGHGWLMKKRAEQNRDNTREWLEGENIPYQTFNKDLHFKINMDGTIIDFWPTTDKVKLGNEYYMDGLERLIKLKLELNFIHRG